MRPSSLGMLLVFVLAAGPALAQSGPNVTLQLPSFQSTGVNTTVVVPDRGAAPLARERQAAYGRSMYGPRRQSAIGSGQVSGGMQVTAQIHDQRAAEAELLRDVRARRTNWQRGSLAGRDEPDRPTSNHPLQSIAEIRRRQGSAESARTTESLQLLAEARRARAEGKAGAAAVYYQMAARRASAAERAAITAEAARAD